MNKLLNRKAIIFGLKGLYLTKAEKKLIKLFRPWGIILFSRNIKNLHQLKSLVDNIKDVVDDANYPILIDQEGGTVSRLNKIIDLSIFSQSFFGSLYKNDKKKFFLYYKIYINKVSDILKDIGININITPVLDIKNKNTNNVLLDRCFSTNLNVVKYIGKICVENFNKNKIATVIKHIPGHGLSKSDSHFKLPIINHSKSYLKKNDFKAFKNLSSLFSMTAHIVYSSYDSFNTATHSKKVINQVIRRYIGFKGIIISDDISMKALKYDLAKNATKALNAGCNLILHCNGKIEEMKKLAEIVPKIDKITKKKTSQFYKFLR